MTLSARVIDAIVRRALDEDLGHGDVTTEAVVPASAAGTGRFVAREPMVVAGWPVVAAVFGALDADVEVAAACAEGARLDRGGVLGTVWGPLAPILTGERVALNLLQRLCGVASWTAQHRAAMGDAPVRLADTRKTTPGLRALEKYAVAVGGGANHRFHLADGVMIKDNHIVAAGGLAAAVRAAQARAHHLFAIQVECDTLEQALEAVALGVRVLLLDNFAPAPLAEAVRALRAAAPGLTIEASGGIRLETVAAYAATGVDVLSCGGLVHQARWVDIGLDLDGP